MHPVCLVSFTEHHVFKVPLGTLTFLINGILLIRFLINKTFLINGHFLSMESLNMHPVCLVSFTEHHVFKVPHVVAGVGNSFLFGAK